MLITNILRHPEVVDIAAEEWEMKIEIRDTRFGFHIYFRRGRWDKISRRIGSNQLHKLIRIELLLKKKCILQFRGAPLKGRNTLLRFKGSLESHLSLLHAHISNIFIILGQSPF